MDEEIKFLLAVIQLYHKVGHSALKSDATLKEAKFLQNSLNFVIYSCWNLEFVLRHKLGYGF